jgi:polar amino acid transport system substrate-binding protein
MLAAACSSGQSAAPTTTTAALHLPVPTATIPPVAEDDGVAAMLPPAVRSGGHLTVATTATLPPGSFGTGDGHTYAGLDPDLATAIGQVLGLKVNVVAFASVGGVITAVRAGPATIGMALIASAPAVRSQVDLVGYLSAGTGFFVKAGSGRAYADLGALCGATVAVVTGSPYQAAVAAQSRACVASGKAAITVDAFPDQNAVTAAVGSDKAEVAVTSSLTAEYTVAQSKGTYAVAGQPVDVKPIGVATAGSGGMAQPVASAVNTLIADGTYAAILSKWGVQTAAVTTSAIDPTAG